MSVIIYRHNIIELLQNISNFSNKIVDVIRKSHEFCFTFVRVITIVVSNHVNCCEYLPMTSEHWQRLLDDVTRFAAILLLSPPSYILYTLIGATSRATFKIPLDYSISQYIPFYATVVYLIVTVQDNCYSCNNSNKTSVV